MTNLSANTLRSLEALADAHLFDEEIEDPKKKKFPMGALAAGAATAGAGYGVARGVKAVKAANPGMTFPQAAKAAATSTVPGAAMQKAWKRSAGQGTLKRIGRAAISGVKSILHEAKTAEVELAKLDLGKTYGGYGCDMYKPPQPSYPSLYIDKDDDSLHDLPEEGTATITYRTTHRSVSKREGKKSSSVTIEVTSIDPAKVKKAKKADPALAELDAQLDEILLADKYEGGYRHVVLPDGTIIREKQKGVKGHLKRHWKKYAAAGVLAGASAVNAANPNAHLAAELGSMIELAGERSRDPEGRFSTPQPPGMDSATMRSAYDPAANAKRQSTVASIAKKAAIGASALGVAHAIGKGKGMKRGFIKGAKAGIRRQAQRTPTPAPAAIKKQPGFGAYVSGKGYRRDGD
jgi:hypothetical protein